MRFTFCLFVLLAFVLVESWAPSRVLLAQDLPPPQSHWTYHLGQGLQLGNSGLTLGGYGSVRYEDLRHHSPQLTLSALSLFVSWELGTRVRFFSEVELEDISVTRQQHSFDARDQGVGLERLYMDVYLIDAATLRFGKFLTPVGRWNLIHADPLVWTTSRPLITSQPFATNTTGGMLYGSVRPFGRDLDYSMYLEVTDDLDPHQNEGPFNEAIGGHVSTRLGATEVGFSYATFKRQEEHGEHENLFGADFFWTRRQLELTGEVLYRLGTRGPGTDEWGLFTQGVAPLSKRIFAIGRYEFFSPKGLVSGVHLWLAALAFRPIPPLIMRAEYRLTRDNAANVPEGFAASLSLLF